jgi:hypothetical protein
MAEKRASRDLTKLSALIFPLTWAKEDSQALCEARQLPDKVMPTIEFGVAQGITFRLQDITQMPVGK